MAASREILPMKIGVEIRKEYEIADLEYIRCGDGRDLAASREIGTINHVFFFGAVETGYTDRPKWKLCRKTQTSNGL